MSQNIALELAAQFRKKFKNNKTYFITQIIKCKGNSLHQSIRIPIKNPQILSKPFIKNMHAKNMLHTKILLTKFNITIAF